jgi:phosphotransferase system  glucose/maltose/N-acetylglucosamine-specific IIC component
MDPHILIALVSGLLNMALSIIVPCLIKKSEQPFLQDVKKIFELNQQVIITSSVIIVLTVYLALKITPDLNMSINSMGLNFSPSYESEFSRTPIIVTRELPPQLLNLVKLMHK